MLIIETPTILRLTGYEGKEETLKEALSYRNTSLYFAYTKMCNNHFLRAKIGDRAFDKACEKTRLRAEKCLLKQDTKGLYTLPGFAEFIAKRFNDTIINRVFYPPAVGCKAVQTNTPRYYQSEGNAKLINARHAAVSIATGLGKSLMISKLCEHYGLQTIVMAPSTSIATQLYKDFMGTFGTAKVGLYGDGAKAYNKLFTIGIAASLTRVKPGTPQYDLLSKAQVFICDESHLCPSDTLEEVCTQMRNDGSDLLLSGITGPIVYNMDVKQGVSEGFLAKPRFFMVKVGTTGEILKVRTESDYSKTVNDHFYTNDALCKKAAELADIAVNTLKHQTVILVEHVNQLAPLLKHLKTKPVFAHGGLTATNKIGVPKEYHKSQADALVTAFNEGRVPLLIGTSCVSIGTDIRPVQTLINLQSGKSEIKVRQAIGRGTRKTPTKDYFNYVDFYVENVPVLQKHAIERAKIYEEVWAPPEWL
jgi:superfamily II DNA or RNA helicase